VTPFSQEAMSEATAAKEMLVRQLESRAGVRLVDIGAETVPGTADRRLILRVHVQNASDLGLPPEINGIPVRVVVADYRLE